MLSVNSADGFSSARKSSMYMSFNDLMKCKIWMTIEYNAMLIETYLSLLRACSLSLCPFSLDP
jgi:hypothetical protein